jgi:hypothetical protein
MKGGGDDTVEYIKYHIDAEEDPEIKRIYKRDLIRYLKGNMMRDLTTIARRMRTDGVTPELNEAADRTLDEYENLRMELEELGFPTPKPEYDKVRDIYRRLVEGRFVKTKTPRPGNRRPRSDAVVDDD